MSTALLVAVVVFADLEAVWAALRDVDAGWVGCACVLALVDRVLLTYRWRMLLRARRLAVPYPYLLRVQFSANFLGSFLPSSIGVDAVRIAALCRSGIAATEAVATTLVDRATIVIATLVFGSLTMLALAGRRLPSEVFWIVLMLTLAVLTVCAAMLQPGLRRWVRRGLEGFLPERIRARALEVARAVLDYPRDPRFLLSVTAMTVMILMLRVVFAQVLALACGLSVGFSELLLVIPILWILVMLPITVGGLGLQEAGYVGLLGLLGVPAATAVTMSLLEHVVSRAVSLPGVWFLSEVAGLPKNRPVAG